MKARIKFQKYGSMKFVGHLDVMRYFQKALRRANFDSEYTKGFSPHQIMTFAAPLGVGLTSDAEYVDLQFLTSDSPEVMMERMNAVLTEGFRIIGFHTLLEQIEHQKVLTAMSLVGASDYLVSLKDGYTISDHIVSQKMFIKAFQQFAQMQEIVIDKKTKNSEKSVDIKPMIRFVAFDEEDYKVKKQANLIDISNDAVTDIITAVPSFSIEAESAADVYENGIKVYMQLDTGSSVNLKPELVMQAFCESIGVPFEKFAWQVHRLEIYSKDAVSGKLTALNQLER
jgi:radical SAM-linked protein